jgi:hypothetical protein
MALVKLLIIEMEKSVEKVHGKILKDKSVLGTMIMGRF